MSSKKNHEFRDAVHGFINCSTEERFVINSKPIQRLRHIHQLAMSYLLYPGGTHRRFEHSLGVMEVATRIFDTITAEDNLWHLPPQAQTIIRDNTATEANKTHWRTVVRMAALCHDIGHVPFSHGAEALLPKGQNHEWITWGLLIGPHFKGLWQQLHITDPFEIAKVAVGPKDASKISQEVSFTPWETLMSEIVVGNGFGADRMDYLLRDSLHTGVAYGRFDIDRLVKTLRFLPKPPEGAEDESDDPEIGVQIGGLHAAESMLWARHFMFSQVYFHPIRKIYDIHLQDFMREAFPGVLTDDPNYEKFLALTDNEVLAAIRTNAHTPSAPGYEHARRIEHRKHFKLLYAPTHSERKGNPNVLAEVASAVTDKFDQSQVRVFEMKKSPGSVQFPVWTTDEQSVPAQSESPALSGLPHVDSNYIFVSPEVHEKAKRWFFKHRKDLVRTIIPEVDHGVSSTVCSNASVGT